MAARMEISGKRYGRAIALHFSHSTRHKKAVWKCICDCGKEFEVIASSLTSGRTNSCGCLKREVEVVANLIHGLSDSPEYRAWSGIIQRGRGSQHPEEYFNRGIRVSERWKDFSHFYEDMGPRPGPGYTIDRIDNDGNYEPGNCRWATKTEQAQNRRSTVNIDIMGQRKCKTQWARDLKVSRSQIDYRLKKGRDLSQLLKSA
jgi:hypothetical protein